MGGLRSRQVRCRWAGPRVVLLVCALALLAAAPAALADRSWVTQDVMAPAGQNGELTAVSCSSSAACIATGNYTTARRARAAFAERWNGSRWRVQRIPTPLGAKRSGLRAVSCPSLSACTAVGNYTDGRGRQHTWVERWNGSGWSFQRTPSLTGARQSVLNGVSCRSATACVAVGSYTDRAGRQLVLAERWGGSRWSVQDMAGAGAGSGVLNGVFCPSRRICVAVGSASRAGHTTGLVERWDGTGWRVAGVAEPAGSQLSRLTSVACSSRMTCVAVGDYRPGSRDLPLAEGWNGRRWSVQSARDPAGATSGDLAAVSCRSSSMCVAVGVYRDRTDQQASLTERLNGTSWSVQTSPNPAGAQATVLSGVACSSDTTCTSVGTASAYLPAVSMAALAERYDGVGWSLQRIPSPSGASPDSVLSDVSCPSAAACTAVGSYSSGSHQLILAERWNGTKWSIQPLANPPGAASAYLNSVSCPDAGVCTAVGYYTDSAGTRALVEHWDGTSWSAQNTPNPAGDVLNAVSCPSSADCIAVGSNQSSGHFTTLAEQWNGTSWSAQATPSPPGADESLLAGVSCPTADFCTAVGSAFDGTGSGGTLAERWDGSTWSIEAGPGNDSNGTLAAVSCPSRTACTAVGTQLIGYDSSYYAATLVERWDGTGWVVQPTPNGPGGSVGGLDGVSCSSLNACTAVGGESAGIWASWSGASWSVRKTGTLFLTAVSCPSAPDCMAVGHRYAHRARTVLAARLSNPPAHP